MIALVDESIVLAGSGIYVLACVVISIERKTAARRAVRRAVPGRTFHWTKERKEYRLAMLNVAVTESPALAAYIRQPVVRRDHEKTRAALLTALVAGLEPLRVTELLIESRQERNDERDRRIVAGQQRAGVASDQLDYRHTGPRQEPLLWLPDALAGAVSAALRKDSQYQATIPANLIRVHTL